MKKLFNSKLSYKRKTTILLGLVAGAVVMAAGVAVVGISRVSKAYRSTNERELTLQDNARQISIHMLMARRHEKDFLLRKDEKYIKENDSEVASIKMLIDDSEKLNSPLFNGERIEKLRKAIGNYEAGFKAAVVGIKKEGSTDTGILGDMRNAAHEIEGSAKKNKLPSETIVHLLTMRRHEKDFLARREEEYSKKQAEEVKNFRTYVKGLNFSFMEKDKMYGYINDYEGKFNALVKNSDEWHKSISGFRDDVHNAEGIINDTIEGVHTQLKSKFTEISTLEHLVNAFFGGAALLVLICVAFSFMNVVRFVRRIEGLMGRLRGSADTTTHQSERLKDASQRVSSATTEQAAAIQETVATLNEISAMVNKTADFAKKSTEKAAASHSVARDGQNAVEEMLTSMKGISESNGEVLKQVDETNNEVNGIIGVINEIATKTGVINDIVFQTKLLSFNASVEAARAGEHGKGFAVVAEEVGSLAQMSGNAAKEISDLLATSMDKVKRVVEKSNAKVEGLVQSGKERVDRGLGVAKKCGEVFEKVVGNIGEVNNMMGELSAGAEEQAEGVNNITTAMHQMDEATHGNAQTSQETSDASIQLSSQANELKDVLGELEEEVFGARSGSSSTQQSTASEPKKSEQSPVKSLGKSLKEAPGKIAKVIKLKTAKKAKEVADVTAAAATGTGDGFVDV